MAKTRTIVAAMLVWLGWLASVHAQPGYAPMPAGGMPGIMPGGMMPGIPPAGMMAPGMMAPGMMPPGMPSAGMVPPGMMPPPLPPAQPGGLPGGPLSSMPPSNAFFQGRPSDDDNHADTGLRGWHFHFDPFVMYYGGARFPALLSTGDVVKAAVPGALGQPGTFILFGGEHLVGNAVPGLRLALERTFGDDDRGSIDIGGFFVQHRSRVYNQVSDATGSPLLTRPFFNPVSGREDADPRAFPGVFAGSTHDQFNTQMYGGEANIRWDFFQTTPTNMLGWGMLVGPRYIVFDEGYQNFDLTTELPVGSGNTFRFADNFITHNHIYGGQIGSIFKFRWDNVSFDLLGKVFGGQNSQLVRISGATQFTDVNGVSTVDNGQGLYAMHSNIGEWQRTKISYGGELGLKFGLRLSENFRFNFGYTLFAINHIVRPGDQIDPTVNIQPLFSGGGLGVARPIPTLRDTVLSTHTITFGCEFLF